MDHKNGRIAAEIIALQKDDGTWGNVFHSLAQPNKKDPLTTEQALRRLKTLGFSMEDAPVAKAVDCMAACLRGERKIDGYWEKTHDWDLFTKLMLSTWIRIFEPDNELALQFAGRWAGDKSLKTSRYLAAIEILAGYQSAKEKLGFVIEWLENNREENGQWDLGVKANDIYFPLSDSWRKAEYRKADCTERITVIFRKLEG